MHNTHKNSLDPLDQEIEAALLKPNASESIQYDIIMSGSLKSEGILGSSSLTPYKFYTMQFTGKKPKQAIITLAAQVN